MSRTELKKYIRKNDLKISVKPKMDDEDIVKAILEYEELKEDEPEKEEKETKEGECPCGHVFGKDLDETPDCDECPEDIWTACAEKAEELENE